MSAAATGLDRFRGILANGEASKKGFSRLFAADDDSLNFMPDVEAAARRRGHRFAYLLSLTSFAFLLIFVVWANFAILDEVTRANGTVIPSSRIQVVQNLEGGILSEILVHEGDIVDEGDVLVRIDNSAARADYGETRNRYAMLAAMIARLDAELSGRTPNFPAALKKDAPEVVADQQRLFEARSTQQQSQRRVLESQVEQRQQEVVEAKSRMSQLQRSLGLAYEERKITKPMVDKNLMPKVDLIRVNREISDLEGQIATLKTGLPRLDSAIREAQQRIVELDSSFKAEVSDQLNRAKTEYKALSETLFAGKDRVTRTEVRSPVRGTVKEVKHTTVGGVIRPAEDIMEIVPLDDSLLIEAQVRPADIAFLRPGQQATVKITAYDYSIYGGLDAELGQISADTLKDENGDSFYRVTLRSDKGAVTYRGEQLPIIPGMTATVEIMTGQKSVLDYLLKPILKARERALRER